jgi:predicted RNA-binding Zn ribbon-like protein
MRDALLLWDLLGGPTGIPDEDGLRRVIVWEADSVSFRPAGEKLWFLYKQRARLSHEAFEAQQRGDREAVEAAERQLRYTGEQILKYLKRSQRAFLGTKLIGTVDSDQALAIWKVKRDVVGPASRWLSRLITTHLAGKVDLVIELSKAGRGFSTAIEPRDLLSAMWLELFFEVTGRTKLRQCPICGAFFDVTNSPRRIYCDRHGSGCRQKAARLRVKLNRLLSAGMGVEEAAAELGISVDTAEFLLRTGKKRP